MSTDFSSLQLESTNLSSLPVDVSKTGGSRQVPNAVYSLCTPTPVKNPALVSASVDALRLIGLDSSIVSHADFVPIFSGNKLLPTEPYAHVYCGHQFGNFAGQLGDGAAITIAEVRNPATQETYEVQLKGAGLTPFSRTADGRKVLRSSIREYLASEALHYLRIPTTRAAACITSDSRILRDPYYNGNVVHERCAIVTRIARSFLRFGSFETVLEEGPSAGNFALQKTLIDNTLARYYTSDNNQYTNFVKDITTRTAELVARWQVCGFVHGVLNTDNMSILGLTIDYGPYGFQDYFDNEYVPNGSDGSARYSYAAQPSICHWNLHKLAEALHPTIPITVSKPLIDETYQEAYEAKYRSLMCGKLGLCPSTPGVDSVIASLFDTMATTHCDFTDTFVALQMYVKNKTADVRGADCTAVSRLVSRCATPSVMVQSAQRQLRIAGPPHIPPDLLGSLLQLVREHPEEASRRLGGAPPEALRIELEGEWRRQQRTSALSKRVQVYNSTTSESKSTEDQKMWERWLAVYDAALAAEDDATLDCRVQCMEESNPTFVLRNWIAQEAILAAEEDDFSKVNTVLEMCRFPYAEKFNSFLVNESDAASDASLEERQFISKSLPSWAASYYCTCSS